MKRLRVGIIGLGVGVQHVVGYQKHPNCEVAALCDFSEEKLSSVRTKCPSARITKEADDILTDPGVDIVSIASYDNYHYGQIKKALVNNKHVFAEKPLCLYEREARDIRRMVKEKRRLKLSSNLILRMSPRIRCIKKMVEEGKFGRLFYLEGDYNYGRLNKITEGWRGKIDFYSVVYGGGVHLLDLLLWLTGEEIVEVAAYGNNISSKGFFKYNDVVTSILRFKSGIVGKMTSNFSCVFPHFHPLSVYGTKATFINGLGNGYFFESRDPAMAPKEISAAYPGVEKGDLISSFVDSILKNTPAEVTEDDIFRVMSVCFAVEKAAQQAKPVRVKYI